MQTKIAVLLTCHNRRQTTLSCLEALFKNSIPEGGSFQVYLVDDGSKDGTSESVRTLFPSVHVINGDGNLYWNGGMRVAFAQAMNTGFDYYLWLNDDTLLYPNALTQLLKVAEEVTSTERKPVVVVGSTHAQEGGHVNYGGVALNGGWWKASIVVPGDKPVPCDTLTGNCVLISKGVVQQTGNLDSAYIHTMGDIDYGFRVIAAGFPLVVMPGFAGTCQSNPIANTYEDDTLPLRVRWSKISHIKGRPFRPWLVFHWRHFGWLGLIYWAATYAKVIITWLRSRVRTCMEIF